MLPEAQGQHTTLKHTTTEAHQSLQTKNNDEPFAKMGGDVFPDASHIPHQIPTICNSKIHGRHFSRTLRKAPRRVHKENHPAGCAQKGTSKDANKKHLEECAQKGTSKDAQRSAANTRALALQKLHRVSTRPKQVLRDTSPRMSEAESLATQQRHNVVRFLQFGNFYKQGSKFSKQSLEANL